MSDDLAIYKSDWMRVLADVGLGASAISKAIELAELNGLFDPAKAALADVAATPLPVRLPFDILNLVHDGIKNGKGSPEITDGIMGLINVARAAAAIPLHDAVQYVVDKFKKDEAQGYHTKDRQFAIDILDKALSVSHRKDRADG